ncbi:MAG: phage tail protein I [Erythrobacter sp.]|nr:phage tail protein I [Erythrobacter sp.]
MTILPPNSTALERKLDLVEQARLAAVPVPIGDVWNPATCPAALLPWLAWGISIDIWDTGWTEQQKRGAIAAAIAEQRRKGTRASLRTVLDRFDPLIEIVEWFEDRENLDPHTFRLELPLKTVSPVEYDTELVAALLRDIAQVKPLRAHMSAVYRMKAQANAWLLGAGWSAGHTRLDADADAEAALDPVWASYLQTEDGEPLRNEATEDFLVAA